MKQGFTLIELLVVIAIIGLISTLAVVGFSTSREKARLAGANSVSSQQLRSYGDDAQIIWEFTDCTGGTITDRSGNNNVGTITGATWSNDSHDGIGCSLNLTGATGYFTASKNVSIPRNNMTVSGWFKTNSSADHYILMDTGGTLISLYSNHVRFCVAATYCTPTAFSTGMTVVNDGKWHFATIVGDSKSVRMYVDGESVAEIAGAVSTLVGTGTIGSSFTGLVDDIFIFNRALTAQEVHQLYAGGISQRLASER